MMKWFFRRSSDVIDWERAAARAHSRGMRLLKETLSPAQRAQYEEHKYFDVAGGSTDRRYRIKNRPSLNVYLLDKNGAAECVLCFMPKGTLVLGDILLAQKLALELFESEALKVARIYRHDNPLLYCDQRFQHPRGYDLLAANTLRVHPLSRRRPSG